MSDHTVTIEWEDGYPSYAFACKAPSESLCHAVWDCDCEAWDQQGIENGEPWHGHDDGEWRHLGHFQDGHCGLREWFENSDEAVCGSLTVPVTAEFQSDYYLFRLGEVTR